MAARESVPLSLRKIPLWTQEDPILDVAVLEESATPTRMAVLDAEKVAIYRLVGGKWQMSRRWGSCMRGRGRGICAEERFRRKIICWMFISPAWSVVGPGRR